MKYYFRSVTASFLLDALILTFSPLKYNVCLLLFLVHKDTYNMGSVVDEADAGDDDGKDAAGLIASIKVHTLPDVFIYK